MRLSSLFTLASALGALAAPASQKDAKVHDIILPAGANVNAVLAAISKGPADVTAVYNNSAFSGFSGVFTREEAKILKKLTDVKEVAEEVIITAKATRNNTPWGLQRVSQSPTITTTASDTSNSFNYQYDSTALGSGVNIYIIDTGINTQHVAFGGRARMGYTAYRTNTDANGHGTHCAGTAAGAVVGVASNAALIGVKVLDDNGSGTSTALLNGINYVIQQHNAAGRSSVASMSLGFGARSSSVERAVLSMVNAGIHVSVAAGNSNTDACNSSPSALGGANSAVVSVGASNIRDQVASFSNSGRCVDVYAPGQNVLSTWVGSTTAANVISGTSMACPHVSGLMAYYLAARGAMSPAAMKQLIVSSAIRNELEPRSGLVAGGQLILANNGVTRLARREAEAEPRTDANAWLKPENIVSTNGGLYY